MTLAPGDVVVVPFPYSDVLAEKKRPAVVVSSRHLEREHGIVWLAMITSASKRWRGDVPVTDLATAGLPTDCAVRAAKIATVSVARVNRKIGSLHPSDWKAVLAELARYSA